MLVLCHERTFMAVWKDNFSGAQWYMLHRAFKYNCKSSSGWFVFPFPLWPKAIKLTIVTAAYALCLDCMDCPAMERRDDVGLTSGHLT